MVATTGAKLLPIEALTALREKLLPRTTIVTPNFPEACLMWREYTGVSEDQEQAPETVADFEAFVEKFAEIAPEWVLVKGGHCPFTRDGKAAKTEQEKEVIVDLLYRRGTMIKLESPYQGSRHTHGTGCSLACESTPPHRWRESRHEVKKADRRTCSVLCSGYCMPPRSRKGRPRRRTLGISLYRGRHQDRSGPGQRKRAH